MTISVCIITKNESAKLAECLSRLKAFPFEIIVVDTGSTDDTKAVASEYTDRIYDFTWCDDFSAARNFSLEKASNDMVLIVDTDEYLTEADYTELLRLIQDNPASVGRIKRINSIDTAGEKGLASEYISRLFDRRLYCYEGKIHEQVRAKSGDNYTTYNVPLQFLHEGYVGSREDIIKKTDRNITLLEKELLQKPKDAYILYQLGKSYYLRGDYEKSYDYFTLATSEDVDPRLEYVQDMVVSYGYSLLNTGRAQTAIFFENLMPEFEGYADFVFLMGLIYMNNEMFTEAYEHFIKATKIKRHSVDGVNSYKALYNAGVIKECLGYTKEAKALYAECMNEYPKAKERFNILTRNQ